MNFKSYRSRANRSNAFAINIERQGQQQSVMIPVELYPAPIPLLVFATPAYIDGQPYEKGIKVIGEVRNLIGFKKFKEWCESQNIDSFSLPVVHKGLDLARLLAKIAYTFAIARFGRSIIDDAYVRHAILGEVEDVGRWVGCIGEQPLAKTQYQHYLKPSIVNGDIHVHIRLFANLQTPEYLVIVGPAPSNFQNSVAPLFIS
jgi:hypothetical protein